MEYSENLSLENITYMGQDWVEKIEEWRDVVGYEGLYMVSDIGRVKTLSRTYRSGENLWNTRVIRERILCQAKMPDGYRTVQLSLNGSRKMFSAHRLVGMAFIPNPENKPQINHINGIKSYNSLHNLEWNTFSENQNHAIRLGLCKVGSKRKNAVLTEEIVAQIWVKKKETGYGCVRLANLFFPTIPKNVIDHVLSGRNWKHVKA